MTVTKVPCPGVETNENIGQSDTVVLIGKVCGGYGVCAVCVECQVGVDDRRGIVNDVDDLVSIGIDKTRLS